MNPINILVIKFYELHNLNLTVKNTFSSVHLAPFEYGSVVQCCVFTPLPVPFPLNSNSCMCRRRWGWPSWLSTGVTCTARPAPTAAWPEIPTVPGTASPAPVTPLRRRGERQQRWRSSMSCTNLTTNRLTDSTSVFERCTEWIMGSLNGCFNGIFQSVSHNMLIVVYGGTVNCTLIIICYYKPREFAKDDDIMGWSWFMVISIWSEHIIMASCIVEWLWMACGCFIIVFSPYSATLVWPL